MKLINPKTALLHHPSLSRSFQIIVATFKETAFQISNFEDIFTVLRCILRNDGFARAFVSMLKFVYFITDVFFFNIVSFLMVAIV